jgi:pilus assembly protein CpaE
VTILFEPSQRAAEILLPTIGGGTTVVDSLPQLTRALAADADELLVVIGPTADLAVALEISRGQQAGRPALGVVLLRRRLEVSMLTEAMRAGVRDVVQPDQLAAVSDAMRRSVEASQRTAGQAGRRPGTQAVVVTVFSAKGGAGKTTVSTNLAAAIADSGRRVCMLDLDLTFGDVGIVLQMQPQRTIADAVGMSGELDEGAVRSLMTQFRPGFDAVLAPVRPRDAERVRPTAVADLLTTLRGMVDVVVVDTPPEFTEHVLTALDASEAIVLVATPDVAALKNLRLAIDTLDQLGYPRETRHIVLNRADERVGLSVADVERALDARLDCRIPSNRELALAFNEGVPLVLASPKHTVSKAIRAFAADVLRGSPTPPGNPHRAGSPDPPQPASSAPGDPLLVAADAASPAGPRGTPKHRRGRLFRLVGGRR